MSALKEAGYWLVGAVGEGGQAPEQLDLRERIGLVLGSEGRGLRRQTLAACDLRVTIPMDSPLSLNVSVAAGILLAEAARQRRA
jgi:23S rRNA (guanosine2251-2'-O)-methyltransferase